MSDLPAAANSAANSCCNRPRRFADGSVDEADVKKKKCVCGGAMERGGRKERGTVLGTGAAATGLTEE